MAAQTPKTLTIAIPPDLHEALAKASQAAGLAPEAIVLECISQHLETALRHRVLIGRLEIVDQAFLDLAAYVGEATAAAEAVNGGGIDLASICRYVPPVKTA